MVCGWPPGVYSKENLKTWLRGGACGSLSVSLLDHSFASRPAKAGWSLNQAMISCLRLPVPTCLTSEGSWISKRQTSSLSDRARGEHGISGSTGRCGSQVRVEVSYSSPTEPSATPSDSWACSSPSRAYQTSLVR
eukprot:scaffold14502_cov61-Phaeocystis_antarctica.AAC.2